jgi:hypothetical protein
MANSAHITPVAGGVAGTFATPFVIPEETASSATHTAQ